MVSVLEDGVICDSATERAPARDDDVARGSSAGARRRAGPARRQDPAPAGVVAFHDRGLNDMMYREYAVRALRRADLSSAVEKLGDAAPLRAANANARAARDGPNPILVGLGLLADDAAPR
ncbi:MAG: hypothetical protein MEP57_06175 [Microvirga sp.]|nr:hypothetical protein [Microvirga sp.]